MTVTVSPGPDDECTPATQVLEGVRVDRLLGRPLKCTCCLAMDYGYTSWPFWPQLWSKKVRAVFRAQSSTPTLQGEDARLHADRQW
jgi:hypothetical protein